MTNKLLIFIIFLITLSCKITIDKTLKDTITQKEDLYIDIGFSDDIIVNEKIVLFDLTNDIQKYFQTQDVTQDATEDILNSGNFIYTTEDLERLKYYEDIFSDTFKKKVKEFLEKENINVNLFFYSDDIPDDSFIIKIKIIEFFEGEFNLIKNLPTKVKISARICKKNSIKKNAIIITKKYRRKSGIDFPIERLRIENIVHSIAVDTVRILKKNYFLKNKN